MIERIPVDLVTPNPNKGNEALDLNHLEEVVKSMGFLAVERTLLNFLPRGWGGNHKHERVEIMAAMSGEPTIVYRDEQGNRIEESMGRDENGIIPVYFVPSWEPHLVENRSDEPVALYELRDRFSVNFATLEGSESLR